MPHDITDRVEEIVNGDWNIYNGQPKETVYALRQAIHQELQKARQTWLRGEIVKLEGMKIEYEHTVSCLTGKSKCSDICRMVSQRLEGANATLQTIIDRYQSELDQPLPMKII